MKDLGKEHKHTANSEETHFYKFVVSVCSLSDVLLTHLFALIIILEAKKNEAETKLKTIMLTTESIFKIALTKVAVESGTRSVNLSSEGGEETAKPEKMAEMRNQPASPGLSFPPASTDICEKAEPNKALTYARFLLNLSSSASLEPFAPSEARQCFN